MKGHHIAGYRFRHAKAAHVLTVVLRTYAPGSEPTVLCSGGR